MATMTWKRLAAVAGICLAALANSSPADIRVDLQLNHLKLLQFEPVTAVIKVFNDSNRPLELTEDGRDGTSRFFVVVRNSKDEPVERQSLSRIIRRRTIVPGEESLIMVELGRFYALQPTDTYTVWAVTEAGGLRYQSAMQSFEILSGLPLATETRAMPWDEGKLRRFQLSYIVREGREVAFLTIDEQSTKSNYGVFELGPLVRFMQPVLQVDRTGLITILHQSGPTLYTKSILQALPDGARLVSQSSVSVRQHMMQKAAGAGGTNGATVPEK